MFTILAGGVITSASVSKDRYLSTRTVIELTAAFSAMEDALSVHFARYGLSAPKFNVLIQLYMAGDRGLTQSELGKKMLVSRANITGLIDRLEKDGLVERGDDPSDKRAFRVVLTGRASALMNTFLPLHNEYIYRAVLSLDTGEKETLIRLLEKLRKGLESM